MTSTWWLLWAAFILFFVVPPIAYGWGYRRWGPPVPRYFQRRRALRAAGTTGSVTYEHYAWGWGRDFVWFMLFISMLSAVLVFWWH